MNNQQSGQQPNSPSNPPVASRRARLIDYVKRKLHERRAKYQNESPADRAARRTAHATVWMAVLTVVLAACAVGGIWISKLTLDEIKGSGKQVDQEISAMNGQVQVMREQLKEMRDEQRAWVYATSVSLEGLSWENGALHIRLGYSFSHVGKNPAVEVTANADGFIGRQQFTGGYGETVAEIAKQEDVECRRQKKNTGSFVFPGQVPVNNDFPDIIIPPADIALDMIQNDNGTIFIRPYIVACIQYRDAVTGLIHGTPYLFRLREYGHFGITIPREGVIPINTEKYPIVVTFEGGSGANPY